MDVKRFGGAVIFIVLMGVQINCDDDADSDADADIDGDADADGDGDADGDADADADGDADGDGDADADADGPPPDEMLHAGDHYFTRGGVPFFWLADDAWALHNRISSEGDENDVEHYLDTRLEQGFTVIHSWMVSSWMTENLAGDGPFVGALDNTDPVEVNAAFFDHVGEVVDLAAERDLYLVLELGQVLRMEVDTIWIGGFDVDGGGGDDPADHAAHRDKAYAVGWHVAQATLVDDEPRWNLIWGLGQDTHPERGNRVGEHNAENGAAWYVELVRSLAEGVADGTNGLLLDSHDGAADYSTTFMSFHTGATGPTGGPAGDPSSTSRWFQNEEWLDYNSHQSGRFDRYNEAVHELTTNDWSLTPLRPVLEAEAGYEEGPILEEPGNRFSDYDQRIFAYWSVFAGATGFQYGDTNVWQFYDPDLWSPRGEATRHWREALEAEGARQMRFLRDLVESRPMLDRVPRQELIDGAAEDGGRHTRLQATGAADGSYAFIYSTNGRDIPVDLSRMAGSTVDAWWYDPRTGESTFIESVSPDASRTFDPPGDPSSASNSDGNDWVLVLDDGSRGFGEPG